MQLLVRSRWMIGGLILVACRPDARTTTGDAASLVDPSPPAPDPATLAEREAIEIGAVTTSVSFSNADRVVAALRFKFRSCHAIGLASDPTMHGLITLTARIAPNGEVMSVDMTSDTGISERVSSCISRAVRNAVFEAPGGAGSTVTFPVKLIMREK